MNQRLQIRQAEIDEKLRKLEISSKNLKSRIKQHEADMKASAKAA